MYIIKHTLHKPCTVSTHYLDQSMLFRSFVSVDILFIYACPLFLRPNTLSISFCYLSMRFYFCFQKKTFYFYYFIGITLSLHRIGVSILCLCGIYFLRVILPPNSFLLSLFLLLRSHNFSHTCTWFNSSFLHFVSKQCLC